MKIEKVILKDSGSEIPMDTKIKSVTISNHGILYEITSDFLGIHIKNSHSKGVTLYPRSENSIVVK